MGFLSFWFVGAVVVGIVANSRGRSGFGFFLLSVVLSPLLGGLLAIGLPSLNTSSTAGQAQPSASTHVRCDKCAEFILPEASVCKHCGAPHFPDLGFLELQKSQVEREESKNLLIGVGFIVALIFGAYLIAR
jgi:phosphate/sulfate permease